MSMIKRTVATNIEWETDGYTDVNLPNEVEIPSDIDADDSDEIADYLSDEYGFLVNSFDIDETNTEISDKLTLTPEQKKLMAEWEDLSDRMNKAGIQFFMDTEFNRIGVINSKYIDYYTADENDIPEDEWGDYTEMEEDDIDWVSFELPNQTVLTGNDFPIFTKFK